MKKIIYSSMLLLLGNVAMMAENVDSLRVEELNEVVVKAVKAQKDAPFAVANISKRELNTFSKTARELPFLFAQTPGVVGWSENGVGTGTTYMRIRGAEGSRINVTIDGVQLNSPEDQCVFWANMNSYASLLGNVQIQRGVGTSTNGDGAFGGSIALTTKTPSLTPSLELTSSYGSYNTWRVGGQFSTGLLFDHLVFDGAYHHTATDGFMHGTDGKSGSYYAGLTWIEDNFKISYKNIGNYERTGQAWNGLDTGDLLDGNYGVQTGLNNYKDFWNAGLGQYNPLYEYLNDGSDATAGTSRYLMNDGSFYPKATDNFWQDHNILSVAAQINDAWSTTATVHYTYGYGYYDELKAGCKLSKFGLSNYTLSDNSMLKKTDFIRKKGMEQNTYGMLWNVNYKANDWDVIGGFSAQQFNSTHFGHLTYIANEELKNHLMHNGIYQYYYSDANKFDANTFVKATYRIDDMWKVFADMQYRHVGYSTLGTNDKFISNDDGTYSNQDLNIIKNYNFFNPKAGVNFSHNGHHAYASLALSHREPTRDNFTDNGSYPAPKPEELLDYEFGYSYTGKNWNVGLNAYYMRYYNQFVQTGEVSDIGEALTTNIKDSYRMGIEVTAGWEPTSWLSIYGNAALSQNKIKDFDEYAEDWDNGITILHYDNSTLAFSPSAIMNGFISFHKWGFDATWHTNYVSKQYLDNTECDQRSLPSYSQSNISASYTLPIKKLGVKELVIGANVNNVFDAHYAANGWIYSAIYASGGHTNDNRYREIGYYPAAGRTVMANLTIKF